MDHNVKISREVGKALCDIYEFCLPKGSREIVMAFMYEPLVERISEGERKARNACANILLVWIKHLVSKGRNNALKLMYDGIFQLFLKDEHDVSDLPLILRDLGKALHFDIFVVQLDFILKKSVKILEARGLNIFQCKISTSSLLKYLAKNLNKIGKKSSIDPNMNDRIVKGLRALQSNRIQSVSKAATSALLHWDDAPSPYHTRLGSLKSSPKARSRSSPKGRS